MTSSNTPLITTASQTITPKFKTTLGCNGSIKEPYTCIDSDLEINAIRLIQDKTDMFIITVDTLFVTNDMIGEVITTLSPNYHLKKEQFMIIASHTHYAPFLDKTKPNLGTVDPKYYIFFIKKLVSIVKILLDQIPKPVDIYYSETETNNIMISRRKKTWILRKKIIFQKIMTNYPNNLSTIDSKLRLIKYCDPQSKKTLAIAWNMACHPVMYPSSNHLTSHFPADIRTHLRKKVTAIPILFLQGFAGDIKPKNHLKALTLKNKIKTIINKQAPFRDFTKTAYKHWIQSITQTLDKLLPNSKKIKPTSLNLQTYQCSLKEIWDSPSNDQILTVKAFYLNKSTIILGISAEIVSAFSIKLKTMFPNITIIPIGYMGSVFGYWPTQSMLKEGGYEVTGFLSGFSINGSFKNSVETCFETMIKRVML
ncbi:MAG: hypothetical protein CMP21_00865 [Rickettsiales bacterium]|nr:hypothetical protein [Rickettsiales bacterium]|tara:strand:- start:185 stop:1456 length:1272 start_codon:yes stop_codon:yes gene_type:complete